MSLRPSSLATHAPALPYESEGRIPFRVRIGVTGHRTLEDEDSVAAGVAATLRRIRAVFAGSSLTPVYFTILSALAEGADRLVVRQAFAVLGENVRVEAILPRDADDYMEDFTSAASKHEFEELLARASTRPMPATVSPAEGFERAGRYVVDQSDVLIAIWDGEPARGRAGTAEVVAYARSRGRPVLLVEPTSQGVTLRDLGSPGLERPLASLRMLEQYNRGSLGAAVFRRALAHQRSTLGRHLGGSSIRADVERVAAWALPRFTRAEVRALRFQHAYHLLGDLLYLFAALAVTAVAAQSVFAPEQTKLVAAEIACLLVVTAVFLTARFGHVHDRWMGYRSLAEAFRSGLFIALTHARDRYERHAAADLRGYHEPWYQRAFSESWSRCPRAGDAAENDAALRRFIVDAWLDHQIEYHRSTAGRLSDRHQRISLTVAALVTAALTVAMLHFFDVGEGTDWPRWFTFLAIVLPGFGAAVTGIREHRQFRLHANRSARTADRLQRLKDQMETGVRVVSANGLAAELQTIILEESVEWTGVQEFQDLELVM